MKRILAAATIALFAGLAGLTACASNPAPAHPTSEAVSETTAKAPASPAESSSSAVADGSVKDACETFNALYAEYKAVPGNDSNAYEDIYLKSEDAKDAVPGSVRRLFAALSLLAIDHSGTAQHGGQPEQESKNAVRDAVFDTAGTCTAEGVTLRL
ncbi:hypothetical protein FCN77_13340 [Arthrobacter sp. 24S4-2]|uniref:hypothetical protein n=1 Tax=Arthrobacter sp. 24S4-2 TaxID=2575374 RepID=UPI0010C7B42A|nr:hypothetical protein [Arthrobacter sp. 24S4-2]QCO98497.1 hypothetical protein FCN77_13340 [Arthrobacter sp. 24S4-2]